MKMSSKAIPSKALQEVPEPKRNRKRTLDCRAKLGMQCVAVTHPLLPNPPVQDPDVAPALPDQPCRTEMEFSQLILP